MKSSPRNDLTNQGVRANAPIAWGRLEMDVDIGNASRMERSRDVAPADLDGRPVTLSEIA